MGLPMHLRADRYAEAQSHAGQTDIPKLSHTLDKADSHELDRQDMPKLSHTLDRADSHAPDRQTRFSVRMHGSTQTWYDISVPRMIAGHAYLSSPSTKMPRRSHRPSASSMLLIMNGVSHSHGSCDRAVEVHELLQQDQDQCHDIWVVSNLWASGPRLHGQWTE